MKITDHRSRSQCVGVAVIGCGYWGPNLVRNFAKAEGARVVAICDIDLKKLAVNTRLFPGVEQMINFRDLLNDRRIDAVAIATPVHTHYELALSAIRAGKHVLVEKPLAQTSGQVQHLIDEAEHKNVVLMVDHTFIYTPAVQKIRDLIRDQSLGEIYYYNSTRASLGLFQKDVNVIWDLAVHDVSIINYILNEEPIAVSATGVSHLVGNPENMAHIALFFQSSCVANISVNWLSPVKVRQTYIGGSRKMIIYDDLEATDKIKVYDKGVTLSRSAEDVNQLRIGYRAGDMWAPHLLAKEALEAEAEHFIACVRHEASPICGGMDGLRVVEILEAACESIDAHGAPVQLGRVPRARTCESVPDGPVPQPS